VTLCVFQVLDNRVGLSENTSFTDSNDSLIGFDNAVGQISPGRTQHQCSESSGLHASLDVNDFGLDANGRPLAILS
jgi:hypothetical protein